MKPKRYRLITAPAHITVLNKPYYYYWDDMPCSARGLKYGVLVVGPDGRMADGDSPEDAMEKLAALGFNPDATY